MSRKYRYETNLEGNLDANTLEIHFTKMANRGWMIEDIGTMFRRYRAVEPQEILFFVDLLPDNNNDEYYRTQYNKLGWSFVAAHKQLNVFIAETENPEPIYKKNSDHADVHLSAIRKRDLIFSIILPLILFTSYRQQMSLGASIFLSNFRMFYALLLIYLIIIGAVGALYIWWRALSYWLAKRRDLPMPVPSYGLWRMRRFISSLITLVILFAILAMLVHASMYGVLDVEHVVMFIFCIALVCAFLWGIWQNNSKKRTRAKNNKLIAIVLAISFIVVFAILYVFVIWAEGRPFFLQSNYLGDRPALFLSDFGASREHSTSATTIESSILVPINYRHRESGGNGDSAVRTHVLRANHNRVALALFDYFYDEMNTWWSLSIYGDNITHLDGSEAAFWGADYAVMRYTSTTDIDLLLRRDTIILRIFLHVETLCVDNLGDKIHALWYEFS